MAREKFQTLTEQMFYILLCLRQEQCGADIMTHVAELTQGLVAVGPGTLYNLLESFVQAGYILLFEENAWLKRTAVKGVALMIGFSLLSVFVDVIPMAIDFVDGFFNLFNATFYVTLVSKVVAILHNVQTIAELVLFLVLGFKALKLETVRIPVIDPLLDKAMR